MILLFQGGRIVTLCLRLRARSTRNVEGSARILRQRVLSTSTNSARNDRASRKARLSRVERSTVLNTVRLLRARSNRRVTNGTASLNAREVRRIARLLSM